MIGTIYVEEAVADHPRARDVRRRFPDAAVVPCRHYGEVFNPAAQDFRLQKRRPALLLARKQGSLVLEAPPGFGIGSGPAFYFSHMLNCLYDCRYCFLQGMFRSAHYVLFVNFEDFETAIDAELAGAAGETAYFFSGYDCDSLALEGLTGFARRFVPFFAQRPDAVLELRTKSVATRHLRGLSPSPNVVVAFSFTPAAAAAQVEHGAPGVGDRIRAAAELAAAGWRIGLRLDPLLWYEGWRHGYADLIAALAAEIPPSDVHSASLGPLRFPRRMFRRIERMYPEEPLVNGPLVTRSGVVSYEEEREAEVGEVVGDLLRSAYPKLEVFSCTVAP